MNDSRIDKAIDEIHSHIKSELWFDFEITGFASNALVVIGGLDLTLGHNLQIRFLDPVFTDTGLEWTTDTSQDCVFRSTPRDLLTSEQRRRYFGNWSAHDGAGVFSFLSESIDGFEWYHVVAHDIEYTYTGTWASWEWYAKDSPPLHRCGRPVEPDAGQDPSLAQGKPVPRQ